MESDFTGGTVYRIIGWSFTTPKQWYYYGSTTKPLSRRLNEHVSSYENYKLGKGSYISSVELFDNADNYVIEPVEVVNCSTRKELHYREFHYIQNNDCVNKQNGKTVFGSLEVPKVTVDFSARLPEKSKGVECFTLYRLYTETHEFYNSVKGTSSKDDILDKERSNIYAKKLFESQDVSFQVISAVTGYTRGDANKMFRKEIGGLLNSVRLRTN